MLRTFSMKLKTALNQNSSYSFWKIGIFILNDLFILHHYYYFIDVIFNQD